MPTVTAILGLCGSGKTWLAERVALEQGGVDLGEGVAPGWPNYQELLDAVTQGKDCVVTEAAYYDANARAALERGLTAVNAAVVIRWIWIEHNEALANRNCILRLGDGCTEAQRRNAAGNLDQNRAVILAINRGAYTMPIGAEIVAMYRVP